MHNIYFYLMCRYDLRADLKPFTTKSQIIFRVWIFSRPWMKIPSPKNFTTYDKGFFISDLMTTLCRQFSLPAPDCRKPKRYLIVANPTAVYCCKSASLLCCQNPLKSPSHPDQYPHYLRFSNMARIRLLSSVLVTPSLSR